MTRHRFTIALLAAACALALGLVLAGTATAARPLQTAIDPDGPFTRDESTIVSKRVREAGASAIRLLMNWREIAPENPSSGFDATDPGESAYDWAAFEAALGPAVAEGLEPIVVIRSAPDWAEGAGAGRQGTVRPDVTHFARFARAAAQRYSGRFGGLPGVRYWQPWNEPNHFGFLNPQAGLAAAEHYRALLNAFADAVHAVNADNKVIAGGLAPFGNEAPQSLVSSPLAFMRALLCMSSDARAKPTCSTRVKLDIWSHHPYTSGSPTHRAKSPDDVSISGIPRMKRLLQAAVRAGHVESSSPSVPLWVTEFAWDSNPPDPKGVPEKLRARWVSEALYRMWRSGVSLVTWFKLRDDATLGRPDSATFQSGFYLRCGELSCDKPKLSLYAFRFPLAAFRSGRRVYVWGRTPSGKRATVIVQQKTGRRWRRLARLRANRYGIFQRRIRTRGRGPVRARLSRGQGTSLAFSLQRPRDFPVNPFG